MGSYFSKLAKKEDVNLLTESNIKLGNTEKIKKVSYNILENKKNQIDDIEDEINHLQNRIEKSISRKRNKDLFNEKILNIDVQIEELNEKFKDYQKVISNKDDKYNDILLSVKKVDSRIEKIINQLKNIKNENNIKSRSKKIKKVSIVKKIKF